MARRAKAASTKRTRKGGVLEMLLELLGEQRTDEVIALVEKLVERNSELERMLADVRMRGKPREGVSTAQLALMLDGLAAADDEQRQAANAALREASDIDAAMAAAAQVQANPPRRQPRVRRPIPPQLRRVENPIEVPGDERPCPRCGGERRCIGHDVTEVIELIPAEIIVRLDQREKLACDACEGELARAPVGDKVVAGGKLGSRLVGELVVDKYDDGLPLHRQKQRLERLGLSLPVSTLGDQITWATDLLAPVARACLAAVLRAEIMHIDGTSLPVLERKSAKGKKLGALWGFVGDRDIAAYVYTSTGKKNGQRPGELGPEEILSRRRGLTVADASSIFHASFARDDLIECACNMHARRYFVKALDRGDERAALPIAAFKKLYEIEEKVRDLDRAAILEARQQQSQPVYAELVNWCETHEPHEPPKSPMGTAIRYLLNHREALMRFLDDARIPLDNGIVERLHVRTALTRKNYLFAGSDAGGERAAIAYTILGSCRLAGVNPSEYLADVLPRLARGIRLIDVSQLIPVHWQAAQTA